MIRNKYLWKEITKSDLSEQHLHLEFAAINSPIGILWAFATAEGLFFLTREDLFDNALARVLKIQDKVSILENPGNKWIHLADDLIHQRNSSEEMSFHIKSSPFQQQVLKALLSISSGNLSTYSEVAHLIARPKAARAVGTAIGKNPILWLIPCHRVVQRSGQLGGFLYGPELKKELLEMEGHQF